MEEVVTDFIQSSFFRSFIVSLAVIAGAIILWFVIKKVVFSIEASSSKSNSTNKSKNALRSGLKIFKYVLIVVVVVAVLQINGVDVTSLIASLGITGAVIGFALQDFLKDLIMGSHIRSDDFFDVDDVVKYGDIEGVVVYFNSKTTKIRDIDTGNIISISNREIVSIQKVSHQVDINIGVDYSVDYCSVDNIFHAIENRVKEIKYVESVQYKGTQAFENSWILYKFRFFCKPAEKRDITRNVNRIIQEEFAKKGISMAYNHLDVALKQ